MVQTDSMESRRDIHRRAVHLQDVKMQGRHLRNFAIVAALLAAVSTARAQQGGESTETPKSFPPLSLDSPYMTGDWGHVRTEIEEHGIVSQLFLNYTYQWNVGGGLKPGGKPGASMDLLIHADLEELGLPHGGKVLGHFQRIMGSGINPWIGSNFQVADDLDVDGNLYVAQLYYENELVEDKLWLRLGYLDYQTIVDRNRFANSEDKQFMSQALDNNPLLPLPESLGIDLQWSPTDWFTLNTGFGDIGERRHHKVIKSAFDGPDEFVYYLEPAFHVDFKSPFGPGNLQGNYRFGMVYDGERHEKFPRPGQEEAGRKSDDVGFYVSFDQDLFRENDTDAQGMSWFFRYGFRHGDISRIQNFWSTGLSYLGPIPSRDKDTLGIALFQSVPSHRYQSYINANATEETVLEAYYSIHVTDWLYITPDVQYLSSPGIDDSVSDCIVVGVRTRISF